jgi:hypothetical protein
MQNKQKIYFLTYGDSRKYSISKKHLISLAKESKFFENEISLSRLDLDTDFKQKYSDILSSPKGGGYWIWKHRIIMNLLNNLEENDIIFYTDAGSSFNYHAKKKFFEYINMLNESEFGNLRFEIGSSYIEKDWTTKELFDYFNINLNNKIATSPQLVGGHLFFKKCEHTHNFFEEFQKLLDFDEFLITDKYNNTTQINTFKENRHDQSIMSLISKKYGGEVLESQTYFNDDLNNQSDFPILSVRNYGHGLKDRLKYALNIGDIQKTPKYFE